MKTIEQLKNDLTKIKTSPYYIAYIDFLGIKNLINSNDSDLYLNYLNMLYNDALNGIQHLYQEINQINIETRIFSDNIVIAIPKEENSLSPTDAIKRTLIIEIAAYIQMLAFKYSLLTRGSIVIGNFFIDEKFVYGKALTKAYQLENDIAIYPRIIMDERDAADLRQSNYIQQYLNKDYEGIYYLNSFECYFEITKIYKEDEIKHIRQILWSKFKDGNSEKINQKLNWLINQFNEFCMNNELSKYKLDIDRMPKFIDCFNQTFENAKS